MWRQLKALRNVHVNEVDRWKKQRGMKEYTFEYFLTSFLTQKLKNWNLDKHPKKVLLFRQLSEKNHNYFEDS